MCKGSFYCYQTAFTRGMTMSLHRGYTLLEYQHAQLYDVSYDVNFDVHVIPTVYFHPPNPLSSLLNLGKL